MPWPAIRERLGRARLGREILIAQALKCVLLYALWWAFFSHAPDKRAIAGQVAEHLIGGASELTPSPSPTPRRNPHD